MHAICAAEDADVDVFEGDVAVDYACDDDLVGFVSCVTVRFCGVAYGW